MLEWRFLFDSVSAFAGEKALPELAEAVRTTVLCAFGCVESSGMTVAGLFRRLADTMPEYLTEEFRNPRWEARADKVAEAVMAKADPAFAEAYEGLRAMTAPYAGMSASSRLFEAQDAAVPGLPDFVPADVPGRRRHFNQAVNECWQRMKRCLEESRAFADLLRQELHHELSLVTIPVQGLLSTDELRQSQWGRDTLAWFLREARADADALAAAFEQDYAQGGRRFAAYFVHRRRVDRMLDALKAMGAAGCFYWRLLDGVCLRMDACGAMPKAGEARPCPFGSAAGDGGAGEDGKAVEDAARP